MDGGGGGGNLILIVSRPKAGLLGKKSVKGIIVFHCTGSTNTCLGFGLTKLNGS